MNSPPTSSEAQNFSVVIGGPIYQLLIRMRLVKPPLHRVVRRVLAITLLAWLPVAVLTIMAGTFWGGVNEPFLYDVKVQVQLLLTLPLLIVAEVFIHQRISQIVRQFEERKIVSEAVRPKFHAILDSAVRLRNSVPIELGMFLLAFVLGHVLWQHLAALHTATWYASPLQAAGSFTAAGTWYGFISVPIVQFVFLRWYFRLFVWARFLWQVSKLELNLIPTHPDRTCGLGFLGDVVFALAPFLIAHSCLLAGAIANQILHDGAKLPSFKLEIAALAVFLVFVSLAPISVFAPALGRARRRGLEEYGRLASDYALSFNRKWIDDGPEKPEALLGSADIQSLADLGSSFQNVQRSRSLPFGKETIVRLVVIVVLPLLPLALTMVSVSELTSRLFHMLV